MIRLQKLTDIDSYVLWFAYREIGAMDSVDPPADTLFFVKLMYCDYWSEEWARENGTYHIEIVCCAPGAVPQSELDRAFRSMDIDAELWATMDDRRQSEILIDYGISATLWQRSGSNRAELMKSVRKELTSVCMLSGFYLDRPCNAIGASGWDFLVGNSTGRMLALV